MLFQPVQQSHLPEAYEKGIPKRHRRNRTDWGNVYDTGHDQENANREGIGDYYQGVEK